MRRRSFRHVGRYGIALMALFALTVTFAWQKIQVNDARSRLAQALARDAAPPRITHQPGQKPFPASLEARLKTEAVAASVSLTIIDDAARKTDDATGHDVQVSGLQQAVLAFVERLETRAPGMTLSHWRLEPAIDGVLLSMRVEPANGAPRYMSPARTAALAPMFAPGENENHIAARPKLVGVAGRLPNDAEALVRAPGGPVRTMRQGDIIMGWQLLEIGPDYSIFARNGQTYVETLKPLS